MTRISVEKWPLGVYSMINVTTGDIAVFQVISWKEKYLSCIYVQGISGKDFECHCKYDGIPKSVKIPLALISNT